jgi:tetratricopeptide (TPR) repeat protein
MKKAFAAALSSILVLGLILGLGTQTLAQTRPTPTVTATPFPQITAVIANFALTGTTGVNTVPQAVLSALNGLNVRPITFTRVQAILNTDAAQAALERTGAGFLVWGAPEGEQGSRRLVIHYETPGRQRLLEADPATKRRVTVVGLYGVPASSELPAIPGLPPALITSFTQAQFWLALTVDDRAKAALDAAEAAIADFTVEAADEAVKVANDAIVEQLRAEIAFYQSYLALRSGSIDIALDYLQQVLRGSPRAEIAAWARINAAALTIRRGDYDNAISLLEEATDTDTSLALAYINLSAAYFRQRDFEQGLEVLDAALEADPKNTYALNNRGYILLQANEPDEALENFRQVIKLDPLFVDAHINQALVYRLIGEFDLALRDINNGINLLPSPDEGIIVLRGDILYSLRRYDQALADFTRAIELNPENDYALVLSGDILVKLGRDAEAVNAYTLAINVDPSNPYPYLQRSQLLLKVNRFKEAALDATSALELARAAERQGFEEALFYRAEAYVGLNRFSDAIEDYRAYIGALPDGRYVEIAQARILAIREFITPTPSRTRTQTPSRTATNTRTFTPSATATATITRTPTFTATYTFTPSATRTETPLPSATRVPATQTPVIIVVTATPPPATPEPTLVPTDEPTVAPTRVPPSSTPRPSVLPSATPGA